MIYSTFLPLGRRADERFFSPDPLVISWILKSMSVFPSSPMRLLENEGFFFSPFFFYYPTAARINSPSIWSFGS